MVRLSGPRVRPRLTIALVAARAASIVTRALRIGGGTVIPGHVASRLDRQALSELALRLSAGTILISGTNGKTTTARLLANIAAQAGLQPIHNRAGANLPAGILSALVAGSDLDGTVRGKLGLFEVDEAHVPAAVDATHPRALILTNLFRDQLDRYGEIDLIAKRWQGTVIASGASLVLAPNVDDPVLAHLLAQSPVPGVSFGIEDRGAGSAAVAHEADRRLCPACGSRLRYDWSFYGHLGHYSCEACGWKRPTPTLAVRSIIQEPSGRTNIVLEREGARASTHLKLPGLHNVYNAAAAVAGALAVGVSLEQAAQGVTDTQGAFGRHQTISLGAGSLTLSLVKNPVGFNQALRSAPFEVDRVTIAINDLFADGTDVSWLWDVDFDRLIACGVPVICTGLRAHDMALRLKYDGAAEESLVIEPRISAAMQKSLLDAENGAKVLVFSTYTATLEIQRQLARRKLVPPFWEG